MVTTIVIVVRAISERQITTFPNVLAIALPPKFLLFKIHYPFDFYVNWKNLLRLVHTFQVI